MAGSGERDLAAWIHQYAVDAARDENVDVFVARVDAAILAEIPVLAEDPVLVADLHASTRAQYQVFLSLLERKKQELLLPPQAVDLVLSIARRQLDLAVVLKVYRVALGAVWEYFTEVAAEVPEDGPDRADVLIYLWDHGGTWINEAVEQLIGVFSAEREATMQGALARRTETVHALLRGEQMPLDEATRVLGHPLRALQTAVVLWVEGAPGAGALEALAEVAHSFGTALAAGLLTVPAGSGELWCWLATSEPPDPAALETALAAVQAAEVRAAVGTTAAGVTGFRDSHREAVDAQRYAASVAARRPLTSYVDVELACLVSGHEAGARALIRRELGGLAGAGSALDRVRETVATYLASGGNVEHTAETLHVHKNTVRYRLSQAEELIGRPLAERRTELGVALACLERYPVVPPSK
ncbi:PucR family transcriptional regulator [Nocardioides panacisoli]|uniref:Helix-turn-helix domain-containing protein n=1 Tax=Nocardioides panacisoli TaxID=627624 RepID=A0ABP7HT58_9ACTN